MSPSELMQAMMDAGAPVDAILIAMRALDEKDALIAARRASDRDRKRKQRGTVTGQSRDVDGTVTDEILPPLSPPKVFPEPLSNTPPISPQPTTVAARKAEPFPKPEWADADVWADLLINRKRKNLPNTASAHRKLLNDIGKLTDDNWPPGRILEAAVSRGWGAIYAGCKDDEDGRTITRANYRSASGPKPDPTLAIVRAAIAAQREGGGDHRNAGPALSPRQFG